MTDAVFDTKSLPATTGTLPIGAGAAALVFETGTGVGPAGEQVGAGAPLKIIGDLTIATSTAQHKTLAGLAGQGSTAALDLSEVHECDTAGLQLIYSLRRTMLQREQRLQIVAVSRQIQELAAALGLQIRDLSEVGGSVALDADSLSGSTTGGL